MLIKNARIVTEENIFSGDLRIIGELITEIESELKLLPEEKVIDADGMVLMPGGVDVHTHFDMPWSGGTTSDDFYRGTRAALAGGTTTVIDFTEPSQGQSLQAALDTWHHKARGKAWCDYGFHMTLIEWHERMPEEMVKMKEQGVTSFKIYMTNLEGMGDTGTIRELLKTSGELGTLVSCHCERGEIIEGLEDQMADKGLLTPAYYPASRPENAEVEAIDSFISLAAQVQAPIYIVHLSSAAGLDAILEGRKNFSDIYAETCPQYLLLDEKRYQLEAQEAAKFMISPPLRKKEDQEKLWQGLFEGVIQNIATDHCSFNLHSQKDEDLTDFRNIPKGMPSVENRMVLSIHHGLERGMDLIQLSQVLSGNPAKIFGMYPQKGCLAVGSDADLILVRLDKETLISKDSQHQEVDYTPYENWKTNCSVEHVFLRGRQVVEDGLLLDEMQDKLVIPEGRFIKRRSFK
ncbi:dihydropyrimidinase [Eubacteriaceae bacterium ES3]|nr:dihydropyrimidinase [Eubacteriaceae bacterium ES3]